MEKKRTIISLIVIAVLIAGVVTLIFLLGIIPNKYNYIQFEVNPKVEFICDKKYNVISYNPLNSDGEIILSDCDYIGKSIEDVTTLFLDDCAKLGYIDVNGIDNALNITIIDGITQALDSRVTECAYNFFKDNEIMGIVVENYEDRKTFDEKKENNVICSNKYKLIKTMSKQPNYPSMEELKKLSEKELLELVVNKHNEFPFIPDQSLISKKQQLLSNNEDKYNKHIKSINPLSQR